MVTCEIEERLQTFQERHYHFEYFYQYPHCHRTFCYQCARCPEWQSYCHRRCVGCSGFSIHCLLIQFASITYQGFILALFLKLINSMKWFGITQRTVHLERDELYSCVMHLLLYDNTMLMQDA